MREDQFMGLPEVAEEFLTAHIAPGKVCSQCGHALPRDMPVIGHYHGMFDTEYPLLRHTLEDGRTAEEFLQVAPWSSGPVDFLGLRVSSGEVFCWTEDEIEALA